MAITAYIMAKNEADNIERCIKSLRWCDEIVVADTGSNDKTIEISQKLGARVLKVNFEGFGSTRNKITQSINSDWIVCFDADEVCTKPLEEEIKNVIKSPKYHAYKAPRQNYFLGQKIKHSGWYPDYRHPVLFQPIFCHYDEAQVHEGLICEGEVGKLSNSFDHFSYTSLDQLADKTIRYAKLGADKLIEKKANTSHFSAICHATNRFMRHYVLKAGFLDGWAGFVIAANSAYGTFLRYAIANDRKKKTQKHLPQ